jgi:hypothetical protein
MLNRFGSGLSVYHTRYEVRHENQAGPDIPPEAIINIFLPHSLTTFRKIADLLPCVPGGEELYSSYDSAQSFEIVWPN